MEKTGLNRMIGYTRVGNILRKKKIKLSKDRIKNHRFVPKTLELRIVNWGEKVDMIFSFDDSSKIHSYCKYNEVSEAMKAYRKIAKANKERRLYVHVYANREARLEIRA